MSTDKKAAAKPEKERAPVHVVLTEENAGGRIAVGPYVVGTVYHVAADVADGLIARKGFIKTKAPGADVGSEE